MQIPSEKNVTVNNVEELDALVEDPRIEQSLIRELWFAGELSYQLRPHGQMDLYRSVKTEHARNPTPDPFVAEAHRRFGKTFFWELFGFEGCLKVPWFQAYFGAPTAENAKKYVIPNMNRIPRDCPPELRPHKSGLTSTFKNPALRDRGAVPEQVFHVMGLNEDPDGPRGGAANLWILDECREILRLKYIVENVIAYMFVKQTDPMLAMISSTPDSAAHDFCAYADRAQASGRYFVIKASENKDFTKEDEMIVLSMVPEGKKSISWLREAECQRITDTSKMIVPEYAEARDDILVEHERPSYYNPEVCFDIGAGKSDFTHMGFGYVDFEEDLLIIEDEIWCKYKSTGELSGLLREKEMYLWGDRPLKVKRFADATLQQLTDFKKDHNLQVSAAVRHDKDVTIKRLRTAIQRRKIRINPRCKHLDNQLRNGIRNDKGTDWVRSEALGHCDGIAMLGYFNRQASWKKNPFPEQRVSFENAFSYENTQRRIDEEGDSFWTEVFS